MCEAHQRSIRGRPPLAFITHLTFSNSCMAMRQDSQRESETRLDLRNTFHHFLLTTDPRHAYSTTSHSSMDVCLCLEHCFLDNNGGLRCYVPKPPFHCAVSVSNCSLVVTEPCGGRGGGIGDWLSQQTIGWISPQPHPRTLLLLHAGRIPVVIPLLPSILWLCFYKSLCWRQPVLTSYVTISPG